MTTLHHQLRDLRFGDATDREPIAALLRERVTELVESPRREALLGLLEEVRRAEEARSALERRWRGRQTPDPALTAAGTDAGRRLQVRLRLLRLRLEGIAEGLRLDPADPSGHAATRLLAVLLPGEAATPHRLNHRELSAACREIARAEADPSVSDLIDALGVPLDLDAVRRDAAALRLAIEARQLDAGLDFEEVRAAKARCHARLARVFAAVGFWWGDESPESVEVRAALFGVVAEVRGAASRAASRAAARATLVPVEPADVVEAVEALEVAEADASDAPTEAEPCEAMTAAR